MIKILDRLFFSRRKEISFIIFFAFLITFFSARLVAYVIHRDWVPDFIFFINTVYIKGYHIHHFNFGIILLSIAGFLSLIDGVRTHVRKIAVLYGVGLSLIVDEFGLLVTMKDVYWTRASYDAVIFTVLLLLNIVYFGRFWRVMGGKLKKLVLFRRNV